MSVSYTGVVLDDISRENLRKEFNGWRASYSDGWEWIAHHMTIKMGQLPEDQRKEMLGQKVTLKINKVANNDMVMAIGVTGFYCEKKIPHITLAVNRAAGAKPYMSDKLTDLQNNGYQVFYFWENDLIKNENTLNNLKLILDENT